MCIDYKMQSAKTIGNYSLLLSYKCNWNCNYCIVDTHNQKDPDFNEIKEKIKDIKRNSFVSINGGEPGLVSDEKLKYVFDELIKKECLIQVLTNGAFLKKEEFLPHVYQIVWHCSENLDDELVLPKLNNRIEYLLVLTDENFHKLDKYIGKYPVNFTIRGADRNGVHGRALNKENSLKVLNKYKSAITKLSALGLITKISSYEKLNRI